MSVSCHYPQEAKARGRRLRGLSGQLCEILPQKDTKKPETEPGGADLWSQH